jgi:hypothetical protein
LDQYLRHHLLSTKPTYVSREIALLGQNVIVRIKLLVKDLKLRVYERLVRHCSEVRPAER